MKTSLICSAVVLGTAPMAASAEDFVWGDMLFQPRAYAGYADYSLESGNMTYNVEGFPSSTRPLQFDMQGHSKLDVSGPIFGLGATVAMGRFFGDAYYQSMLNETAYSSIDLSAELGGIPLLRQAGDVDAQHSDWAFSLGYRMTDQWSVFAGYKSGKTDWDQSMRVITAVPPTKLLQDGGFAIKFEQDGPFLGTSYSFLIGPGALTIKGAYAYLDGAYTSDFNGVFSSEDGFVPVSQNFSWDGDSNAFSFGVSWTQSLTDNLGLSVGANYHRYEFDASGSKQFMGIQGDQIVFQGQLDGGNLTEELFTLTTSVLYTF